MSLDYDGANSKAQNDTATGFTAALWTFLAWLHIDTAGESTTGRIFTTDETSTGGITIRTISTTAIRFSQARATTVGIWDYAYTTGQWFALMVSYDTTNVSNVPVFGKMILGTDKSLQSITATVNSTPVGALTSTASGYCIGNRADQLTTFDGRIHRPRFYNRILTLDEATEELWRPGTVTNGLVIHIDDKGVDRSGNGWNATLTSTTLADPPPDIPLEFGFDGAEPYVVASAAVRTGSRGKKNTIHPGNHPSKFGRYKRTRRNQNSTVLSPITGTLAKTNANDSVVASGTTNITGTLAKTNTNDTVVASGTTTITGTLARTNANDSVVASGITTLLEGSRRLKKATHVGRGPYNFSKFKKSNRNYSSTVLGTITGTLARTNANDTVVASGSTTVTGALAKTNANDTLVASGSTTITGTLAKTNANDTVVASGTTTITGTLVKTNASDSLSASGTNTITGSVAKTNANDTLVSSGTTTVTGTLARTNANDTLVSTGSTTVTGTLARTNANDSVVASGSVGSAISGTLAKTNANDTLVATGTTTVTGTLAKTNTNDTLVSSGTTTVTGTLARTNANDSVVASGSVGSAIGGTLAKTNANDTVSASGTTTVTGTLARTNANDSLSASGKTTITGVVAKTNNNDSVIASGTVSLVGVLSVFNANDLAVAYGFTTITGTLAKSNANDTCNASGTLGVFTPENIDLICPITTGLNISNAITINFNITTAILA